MKSLTTLFKALADQNRLIILYALLNNNELCACQLTKIIQVTGATASRHMSILISAGIVESRKKGRWVYYRIRKEAPHLKTLIPWMETQMKKDPAICMDNKTLNKIKSCALGPY